MKGFCYTFIFFSFLNQWELLKNMDDGYERMKMSDAIGNKQFKKGDIIG